MLGISISTCLRADMFSSPLTQQQQFAITSIGGKRQNGKMRWRKPVHDPEHVMHCLTWIVCLFYLTLELAQRTRFEAKCHTSHSVTLSQLTTLLPFISH